jgi:hypothetical protein
MAIARLLVFSSIFGVVFGDTDHILLFGLSLMDSVGDPTDWVSVNYVVSKSQNLGRDSTTSDAENAIVHLADKYSNGDPFGKHAKV